MGEIGWAVLAIADQPNADGVVLTEAALKDLAANDNRLYYDQARKMLWAWFELPFTPSDAEKGQDSDQGQTTQAD